MANETKTLTAVLLEDEANNQANFKRILGEYCPNIELIGISESVQEGLELIQTLKPQILFLDIELQDGSSFDVLAELSDQDFQIVFTTAFDNYALQAIKYAALDYLLKPIVPEDLVDAVQKIEHNVASGASSNTKQLGMLTENLKSNKQVYSKIALPTFEGIDFINVEDIIHCEANRSYSNFYLTNKEKLLVSKSLSEFDYLTNSKYFLRVHRSHMINLKHVKKYIKGKGGYVVMSDGSSVDVAAKRKDNLLQRMGKI